MKRKLFFGLLLMATASLVSCKKDDPDPSLSTDKSTILVNAPARDTGFMVNANLDWKITVLSGSNFVTVTPASGNGPATVRISVAENTTFEDRMAQLKLEAIGGEVSAQTITLTQAAAPSVTIDGTKYPTVTIGTQTWMAANYSGSTSGVYYNNDAANAAYGKLYTSAEAQALTPPTGWHLPTLAEYKTLFESQGVVFSGDNVTGNAYSSVAELRKLMSTTGWKSTQGTNASKFNGMPSGYFEGGTFGHKGESFVYWTATASSGYQIYFGLFGGHTTSPYAYYSTSGPDVKFSVRFIKN